ncbi:MAG: DNA polymerase III subunit alpha [Bacillales bacterium]
MYFPLHLYSEYNFLESGLLLKDAILKAKQNNFKTLALTDKNTLIALPLFNKIAKENDIKPIFGMEFSIDEFNFIAYIKNEEGYTNLILLSTLLNTSNYTLSIDDLIKYKNGLIIVLTSKSLLFKDLNDDKIVKKLAKLVINLNINEDFYIGLDIQYKNENIINYFLELSQKYSYKLIITNTILYLNNGDEIVIDIISAIKNKFTLERNFTSKYKYFYFKNTQELLDIYPDELISSSYYDEIINKIDFDLISNRGKMFSFDDKENNLNSESILINKIYEGLKKRNIDTSNPNEYNPIKNRLNYEYSIIKKMGYCNYFLIVQDIVLFAKNNNIPVGPGRGSACGSLISYILEITEVNPLEYNLLFERFLNPKRMSMPDIDIDFAHNQRELVINYLKEKYGYNKVSNILTVQKIGAKQALWDIGRVFRFNNIDINNLSKLINEKNNSSITLDEAFNKFELFRNQIECDPINKEIFMKAKLIEGLARDRGINAAGIILNEDSLFNKIPLYNENNFLITQYEKDYLEEQNFLKMDILGLINLTNINNTIEYINKTHNKNYVYQSINNINYKDSNVYSLLSEKYIVGIFQIETDAANSALNSFVPRNFDELVAFISLVRPGPRIHLESYSKRVKGLEKITYPDKSLENILKDTYGIIIYQEQIMLISRAFAGFSFSEADLLRRACSKKNKIEMEKLKEKFIQGALNNNHSKDSAIKIFDIIQRFAEYGFNKSHAVAYAKICFQTLYLKHYYPLEFYCSYLNSQHSKNNPKFNKAIEEIKYLKINLATPDINYSSTAFEIKDNSILAPLTLIGGGNNQFETINKIIFEREKNGLFKNFKNFIGRMLETKLENNNKISLEQLSTLISAGCFDNLETKYSRKALKQTLGVEYNSKAKDLATSYYLFNNDEQLEKCEDNFNIDETIKDDLGIKLQEQFEAIGFIINDPRYQLIKDKYKNRVFTNITDLKLNQNSLIICSLSSKKTINTKNKKTMCFLSVYDEFKNIEVTVFPDEYDKYCMVINNLIPNDMLILKGSLNINKKNNSTSFILDDIKKVEDYIYE